MISFLLIVGGKIFRLINISGLNYLHWLPQQIQQRGRRVAGPKRVISYPDGYHALLVDNQRERVFEDIATWIARMTERR